MTSPEHYPSKTEKEQAAKAWASIEKLLPEEWQRSVKEGWVEPRPHLSTALDRRPRPRSSNFIGNAIHRALGNTETYRLSTRSASLGVMPEDEGYLMFGYGRTKMPPKLVVRDDVFKPINPVDGQTATIRHAHVLFRTHTSGDWYGQEHEDGLTFDFLGVVSGDDPTPTNMHASFFARNLDGSDNEYTRQFLGEHGFYPGPYLPHLGPVAIAQILDLCLAEASADQDQS